ncbi:MAG: hypothetical protein NT005_08950 [Spirochaetes bacterium]|nr:hypothetical protein [Spirochaetota bacterium]
MRKLAILLLALLVLFTAGSCKLFDMLFYKAPGVSAKDLASYSGTLPTTRDQTLMTIGYGGLVTMEFVGAHVASSSAWEGAFPSQAMSGFNAIPSIRLLAPFISKMKAKSISLTQTITGDSLDKEFHLDIENESVNVAAQGGTGTATIEKCKADLTATLTASTAPFDADGEGELDAVVTASNLKPSSGSTLTVNTAKIGAKAKGTTSMSFGSTGGPTSVEYNITADAKVGFSISNSAEGEFSGKFIIEMNYIDSGSLSESELADPATGISSIEFTITIKVYDNNNDLVDTYELNQDDLVTLIESGLK